MKKNIIYDSSKVVDMVKNGENVFVGQYRAFDKTIIPADKLIYESDRGFVQVGVERNGCDFIITKREIEQDLEKRLGIKLPKMMEI